jgi:hypothetical protein
MQSSVGGSLFRHNPLYVAEAGTGGPGNTTYCVGQTGAVTLIKHRHIASSVKLPSVIQAGSNEVAGPAAVAFGHGQGQGQILAITGLD